MSEKISYCQNQQSFLEIAQQKSAEGYTHLPVVREILADLDTPVSIYLKLANRAYTYLLESVQRGNEWGRYSIIGLPCQEVYRFNKNQFSHECNGELLVNEYIDDPLKKIDQLHQQYNVCDFECLPDMYGGLVGYFSYDSIQYIEPKLQSLMEQSNQDDEIDVEDITLLVSEDVIVFDNLLGRIYLVSLANLSQQNAYDNAVQKIQSWCQSLALPLSEYDENFLKKIDESQRPLLDQYRVHFPQKEFEKAVETCRTYIQDGEVMQVVLSQRLSTEFAANSFDVYRVLRTINPSPYMYYFNLDGFEIIGSSPEILVKKVAQTVTLHPIAGTRRRGKNPDEDAQLVKELLSDEKELAEHLMLIDLGRNDIGKIAEIGTVKLTQKMEVEKYSHVMHIVSNVIGQVKKEMTNADILKATFPAGTVSGAPKYRAMEIINELEPYKRGIYSGAIGYLAWNGALDTAIAIRTAIVKNNRLYVQAGAGIVADSVPEYEWEETLSKAKAMLTAVHMVSAGEEG